MLASLKCVETENLVLQFVCCSSFRENVGKRDTGMEDGMRVS